MISASKVTFQQWLHLKHKALAKWDKAQDMNNKVQLSIEKTMSFLLTLSYCHNEFTPSIASLTDEVILKEWANTMV